MYIYVYVWGNYTEYEMKYTLTSVFVFVCKACRLWLIGWEVKAKVIVMVNLSLATKLNEVSISFLSYALKHVKKRKRQLYC